MLTLEDTLRKLESERGQVGNTHYHPSDGGRESLCLHYLYSSPENSTLLRPDFIADETNFLREKNSPDTSECIHLELGGKGVAFSETPWIHRLGLLTYANHFLPCFGRCYGSWLLAQGLGYPNIFLSNM